MNLKTEVSRCQKTHQIKVFSPHEFKSGTIIDILYHLRFVLVKKTRSGKLNELSVEHLFSKCFPSTRKKAGVSNSSGLKRVVEKLRFRDGLVWTVGLVLEIAWRGVFKFLQRCPRDFPI